MVAMPPGKHDRVENADRRGSASRRVGLILLACAALRAFGEMAPVLPERESPLCRVGLERGDESPETDSSNRNASQPLGRVAAQLPASNASTHTCAEDESTESNASHLNLALWKALSLVTTGISIYFMFVYGIESGKEIQSVILGLIIIIINTILDPTYMRSITTSYGLLVLTLFGLNRIITMFILNHGVKFLGAGRWAVGGDVD